MLGGTQVTPEQDGADPLVLGQARIFELQS